MIQIIDRVVAGLMLLCAAAIGLGIYWMCFDMTYPAKEAFRATQFDDGTGKGLQDIHYIDNVHRGQTVSLYREVCISLSDPADLDPGKSKVNEMAWTGTGRIHGVQRSKIIDGYIVLLPDREFDIDEGCYNVRQQIEIPRALPSGPYVYKSEVEFFRNRLQLATGGIAQQVASVHFNVVD